MKKMKKLLFMLPVVLLLAVLAAPAQEGVSILVSDQAVNSTPIGTQFLVGFGTSSFLSTEVVAQRPIPVADAGAGQAIIGNLHVRMSTNLQGAGATFQVTLRTCTPTGTPLACTATSRVFVTCTIASGDADCSNTFDTFTVAAGDFIDWQTVQTGTGVSSTYAITFTIQ